MPTRFTWWYGLRASQGNGAWDVPEIDPSGDFVFSADSGPMTLEERPLGNVLQRRLATLTDDSIVVAVNIR